MVRAVSLCYLLPKFCVLCSQMRNLGYVWCCHYAFCDFANSQHSHCGLTTRERLEFAVGAHMKCGVFGVAAGW